MRSSKGSQFERAICKKLVRKGYKGSPLQRFWRKVQKAGPDECWLWKTKTPMFWFEGRMIPASRFLCFIKMGERLPRKLHGLHTCDTPRCMNPAHIFAGTHTDNMKDKVQKGRQAKGTTLSKTMKLKAARGERCRLSKLNTRQVLEIRALRASGIKIQQISDRFSIDTGHVSNICNRKIWRHI